MNDAKEKREFLPERLSLWHDSYELSRALRTMGISGGRNKDLTPETVYYMMECADHIESLWDHTVALQKEYCKAKSLEFIDPNDDDDDEDI